MRRDHITFAGIMLLAGTVLFVAIIASIVSKSPESSVNSLAPGVTPSATTPPNSVVIEIASSNTKELWINALVEKFNAEEHRIEAGERIVVQATHVTSGGSQRDILGDKLHPAIWSPGDMSWIESANEIWRQRHNQLLVSQPCNTMILAPNGFAMWRPMAEALGWPDKPIGWDDLVELAAAPDGWASLGHPEWGTFKFGHTHPDYSNSGLLMLTALAYSATGKTSGLTPDEVYSETVVEAFRRVELNTYHYGIQSRDLIALMVSRGPEYLHAVTTSEAETLKTNAEKADQLRFPLVFVFPTDGTYWGGHPYCVLDAEWVSPEQKEAAAIFLGYALEPAQQALAIDNYLRPLDQSIPLHSPLALENGTNPQVTMDEVPDLESPSAEVAGAVKDNFHATKKKAVIILVLDTSGSMNGDKIKNAVEGAVNFIGRLDKGDEIYVLGFNDTTYMVGEGGMVSSVGETLIPTVNGLIAEGGTALHDGVCEAAKLVDRLKTEDEQNQEQHLYGIVLLSDGDDTASQRSENQMFNCLPDGESVEGVKVFTIAYGDDANEDLMTRIANRTNGKSFTGDAAQINQIYTSISAEQ